MEAFWSTTLYVFDLISNFLNFFKNLIEFLAVIISVITFFFFMINKFAKALNVILKPLGLGFRSKVHILFICRKSPVKKRAFLEYALLQTQGGPLTLAGWRDLIAKFKVFYVEHEKDLAYTVPNCTFLISEEFSNAVAAYFEFFSKPKVKRTFGISDPAIPWVLTIRMEESYVTPTYLLTGLLAKYEENWSEFIKRYVSSAYISENETNNSNRILSNELYLTFAWLLWGPSYEIDVSSNYWDGLCQVSYGDESNSIPALVERDGDFVDSLLYALLDRSDKRYGTLVSTDIRLYESKEFMRRSRTGISAGNTYFYNKLETDGFSFISKIENCSPYKSFKEKKYYCTAYVWILFELETDESDFHPEKTVAFFEHANLADTGTYLFLTETLVDKSLKHFKTIFENPDFADRKYRFVCGLNDEIEDYCNMRYKQAFEEDTPFAEKLRSNVSMTPKRSPVEAFAAFDDFFSNGQDYHFVDIDPTNKEDISNLALFYTEIYLECFPDANERETFDNLLYYMKSGSNAKEYRYHIMLIKDEEETILGGAVYDYFPKANAGVIEFLAIRPDRQSAGVGSVLYPKVIASMNADAQKFLKKNLDYVFCEMDSPEYSPLEIKKYMYFWHRQSFRRLNMHYIQPALSSSQSTVNGLWFAAATQRGESDSVPTDIVLQVLHDYMKYSMQIENPAENTAYKEMEKEIKKAAGVSLLPLVK